MILVYHRVAEATVDPWVLGVSPRHFAQQLEVLQAIAHPISLEQLASAKSDRDLPPRPVCVTFDDGYADNLYAAKPALEKYRVPATVFIAPGYLGFPENLWWDELAKLILDAASRLDEISFQVRDCRVAYSFQASPTPDPDCKWRAWDAAPGPREAAYLTIYEMLVKLSEPERDAAMEQLRRGATYTDRSQHRALTEEEVRELAKGEFVTLGAHTLTHPILAQIPAEQQQQEIAGSKSRLQSMVGKPVTTFAYPYGKKNHYTRQTVKTVQDNGFTCACSNFGGLVTRSSNRFQLPRFQPLDWDGAKFADVVEGWYRD